MGAQRVQNGAQWSQMEPPGEPKGAKMVSLDAPGTPQDDPDTPQDVQGIQNGAKMEDKWSQMQQN